MSSMYEVEVQSRRPLERVPADWRQVAGAMSQHVGLIAEAIGVDIQSAAWKKKKLDTRMSAVVEALRAMPADAVPTRPSLGGWLRALLLHEAQPDACRPADPLVVLTLRVRQIHPDAGFPNFPQNRFTLGLLALTPERDNPLITAFPIEALLRKSVDAWEVVLWQDETWKPATWSPGMKEVTGFRVVVPERWAPHLDAGKVWSNAAPW